jgi:hypothetical protein
MWERRFDALRCNQAAARASAVACSGCVCCLRRSGDALHRSHADTVQLGSLLVLAPGTVTWALSLMID